jgi:hypothetical protein
VVILPLLVASFSPVFGHFSQLVRRREERAMLSFDSILDIRLFGLQSFLIYLLVATYNPFQIVPFQNQMPRVAPEALSLELIDHQLLHPFFEFRSIVWIECGKHIVVLLPFLHDPDHRGQYSQSMTHGFQYNVTPRLQPGRKDQNVGSHIVESRVVLVAGKNDR